MCIRDRFHCEPMEKVSETFIEETGAEMGGFDNVKECRYTVPDYWDIGEVYERLIEDCYSCLLYTSGQDHGSAEEQHVIKGRDLIFCG